MAVFVTKEAHGYAVKYSPFIPCRIACATSQNFGIAGGGQLLILDLDGSSQMNLVSCLDWNNSLFDVTWSESNEHIAATASGDGSVILWHTTQFKPLQIWKEHTKEVYAVEWCQTRGTNFILSASWDETVKLWDASRDKSLATFPGHNGIVYSAIWAPLVNACFASTSGDKTLRIWDIRKQHMPQMVIPASNAEILSCDWCKYNKNLVVTADTQGFIRGWDLRHFKKPVFEIKGHDYAIRRIKCSPFQGNILLTCSYDFSVRTWNIINPTPLETINHHSEFVCGIDFNMHIPGQIVDCSWDQTVKVYSPQSLQPSGDATV